MKIIIAVVLTVLLVFVLTFLFAAMKINGNGTSKFEEDIEQKKYIDDMQSKKLVHFASGISDCCNGI